MSLNGRLARLEYTATEGRLAERADAYARAHDLPTPDVLGEVGRVFALSPAERAQRARDLVADGIDDDPACAGHGGLSCAAAVRLAAEGDS